VADALSATKGVIYAYDMNGTVVFSLNVSTTPSAMTIDHTRQRLYVAIATNLLAYAFPTASPCKLKHMQC
jgi:hypothetical protein